MGNGSVPPQRPTSCKDTTPLIISILRNPGPPAPNRLRGVTQAAQPNSRAIVHMNRLLLGGPELIAPSTMFRVE